MWHAARNLFCLPVLVAALLAPADAEADSLEGAFSDRLDVVAVEIELVVTDRKGRPVTDLDRTELELFHDGVRRQILYLDPPSNGRASTRNAERPRRIVIYADNLRIWPHRRNALLRRLDGFVEQRIAGGDLLSVAAFDGSVELLAVDSRHAGHVRAALEMLASRPTAMAQLASEARQLRLDLAAGAGMSVLEPRIERYVERLRLDAARSAAGLAATVRALARRPASTSILYLSDGIPAWPGDELQSLAFGAGPRIEVRAGVVDDPASEGLPTPSVQYLVSLPRIPPGLPRVAGPSGAAQLLEPLARVANAHGVTFYPLKPPAFSHPSLGGSGAAVDLDGPLRRLAERTGGDFVAHARFEAALAVLSRRLDSAYTLGFQVPGDSDRAFHTLEVQLGRKGLKAHHRRALLSVPNLEDLSAHPKQPMSGWLD